MFALREDRSDLWPEASEGCELLAELGWCSEVDTGQRIDLGDAWAWWGSQREVGA